MESKDLNSSSEWTTDLENILDKIRLNSMTLSEYHKIRYYRYKSYLKYFKIPTIIFSAFSSVFSVGLQNYVEQSVVSLITCLIGLFVGILNSLELFLGIAAIMESELTHSRDFYLLSVDIFKTLRLQQEHRSPQGRGYLDEKYSMYCKLVENSILIDQVLTDNLLPITEMIRDDALHPFNRAVSSSPVRDKWLKAMGSMHKRKPLAEKPASPSQSPGPNPSPNPSPAPGPAPLLQPIVPASTTSVPSLSAVPGLTSLSNFKHMLALAELEMEQAKTGVGEQG